MKNLFVLFAVVLFSNVTFGQLASVKADSSNYVSSFEQFFQKNDTLILTGIQPKEVKVELVEYASNVGIRTEMVLVNQKAFTDEEQVFVYKVALSEAIEEKCKIISKLDKFREKNIQLNGKTPIIERQVTVYVKQNTTVIYAN
jgi:hypothetical protein